METENNAPILNREKVVNDKHDILNTSFLPFTEEELKELNFTPEELEMLEDVAMYSQSIDMIPDDYDEFEKRLKAEFSDEDEPDVTLQKLTDLIDSDPDFVNQMLAVQEVFSDAKLYNEEDSESEK